MKTRWVMTVHMTEGRMAGISGYSETLNDFYMEYLPLVQGHDVLQLTVAPYVEIVDNVHNINEAKIKRGIKNVKI